MLLKRDRWRVIGRIMRWTLFFINLFPWLIGIISIIGGFALGFQTQLIRWPITSSDLGISTPATVFTFYGSMMILVATFGFFAASSANKWVLILYLVVGFVVFIVDASVGISLFVKTDSMTAFMKALQDSINDYGVEGKAGLGIFSTSATEFWDYLQIRGDCCGYFGYEDWKSTPIGVKDSIPTTCCQVMFRNKDCGNKIWSRHGPDSTGHPIADMLITKGCKTLFPDSFLNSLDAVGIFGMFIGACFIICFILAFALVLMVFLNKYHADWGIVSLQLKRLGKLSTVTNEGDAGGSIPDESSGPARFGNKVAPAPGQLRERYLYKSIQVNDGDADDYAPELKRKRLQFEELNKHRSDEDLKKPRTAGIANTQILLEKVSVPSRPRSKGRQSIGVKVGPSINKKPRLGVSVNSEPKIQGGNTVDLV